MTNSCVGFVSEFIPSYVEGHRAGTLVIEQGRRKKTSTKLAFRAMPSVYDACMKLKKEDYVQVTFKVTSYQRRGDKGNYWITLLYVQEVMNLKD